jgi:hypothetical protein
VLLPLSNAGLARLQEMAGVHWGCTLRASPFCHETPDRRREMRGWVMDIPSNAAASALPIPYNLFHGLSVAMCELREPEILALMQRPDETRRRIGAAVDQIMREVVDAGGEFVDGGARRATWARCRPTATDGVPLSLHSAVWTKEGGVAFVPDANAIIDSEEWLPELSPDGLVGLYFRWNERKGRESRLCMYVACQAYLPKACLEFADMVHRLEDACTGGCVSLSEEVQWLRTACARNRARLIALVSEHMGLRVPLVEDYCAAPSSLVSMQEQGRRRPLMALVVTETLHHDLTFSAAAASGCGGGGGGGGGNHDPTATPTMLMAAQGAGTVRVLNHCIEACRAFNGSLCSIAPWDSLWVFRGGTPGEKEGEGDTFGHICGRRHVMLPTAMPRVASRRQAAAAATITTTTGGGNHNNSSRGGGMVGFTTARPGECRVLQVWCGGRERRRGGSSSSASSAASSSPSAAAAMQPRAAVQTLEEDVLFAYRKVLAMGQEDDAAAMPAVVLVGALAMEGQEEEEAPEEEEECYLSLDEAVLAHMTARGWRRELGRSKLIPLASPCTSTGRPTNNTPGVATTTNTTPSMTTACRRPPPYLSHRADAAHTDTAGAS